MAGSKRRRSNTNSATPKRGQSAIEYITTYGWAIVILGIVISILYLYTSAPAQAIPDTCSFVNGVFCQDIILGTNSISHATTAAFLLTNSKEYSLKNPVLYAQLNGKNSVPVNCEPPYVLPGGSMICTVTLPVNSTIGALISGNLYLNATYCGLSNQSSNRNCSNGVIQTYTGSFEGHTQSASSSRSSILLTAANYTQTADNQPDQLTATVLLLGFPSRGATVNFTSNNSNFTITPTVALTNGNGQALSSIAGGTIANVLVTANYGNLSNSIVVHFAQPVYVKFIANFTYCSTAPLTATIDGIQYTCSELSGHQFGFSKGSVVTYSFNTPIISGLGIQESFSNLEIQGIKYPYTGGNFTATQNLTIPFNYQTQYYLTESANPFNAGTVSPGSNWYNSSGSITISETATPPWVFNSWVGSGAGSYTGSQSSALIVMSNAINETAEFSSTTSTTTTVTTIVGQPLYTMKIQDNLNTNLGCVEARPTEATYPDQVPGIKTVSMNSTTGSSCYGLNYDLTNLYGEWANGMQFDPGNELTFNLVSNVTITGTYSPANSVSASYLYVTLPAAGTVVGINMTTKQVAVTIPVGSDPESIAINPAGTYLYVGNAGSKTISVISTLSATVVATIPVPITPSYVAVSPNGAYVAIVDPPLSSSQDTLSSASQVASSSNSWLNTLKNSEALQLLSGTWLFNLISQSLGPQLVLAPMSQEQFAVTTYHTTTSTIIPPNAEMAILNTANNQVTTVSESSASFYPPATFSSDSSKVYVSGLNNYQRDGSAQGEIYAISASTGQIVATITSGRYVNATHSDNDYIMPFSYGSSLYADNDTFINTKECQQNNGFEPTWDLLYYANMTEINTQTNTKVSTTPITGYGIFSGASSPDGSTIYLEGFTQSSPGSGGCPQLAFIQFNTATNQFGTISQILGGSAQEGPSDNLAAGFVTTPTGSYLDTVNINYVGIGNGPTTSVNITTLSTGNMQIAGNHLYTGEFPVDGGAAAPGQYTYTGGYDSSALILASQTYYVYQINSQTGTINSKIPVSAEPYEAACAGCNSYTGFYITQYS